MLYCIRERHYQDNILWFTKVGLNFTQKDSHKLITFSAEVRCDSWHYEKSINASELLIGGAQYVNPIM